MTLGNVAKIGLDEAQRKARKLFGKIAEGKDPANEKAVARTEASHTFDVIASEFLRVQQAKLKPRTPWKRNAFCRSIGSHFTGLALASISRATVAAQLRIIAKDHGLYPPTGHAQRSPHSSLGRWGKVWPKQTLSSAPTRRQARSKPVTVF